MKVFDQSGRFLRRIGREGSGPGEYRLINFLFPRGSDSIEVLDIGLQRATILGPELTPIRMYRLVGGRSDVVRTDGGTYITAARINQPESVGLPLHVISRDGEVILSFGATPPIQNVANRDLFFRQLTPAEDDSFWAAHLTRYALEQWTADGQLMRALTRDVDWFPAQEEFGTNGPEAPPHPGLRAVSHDGESRLWVAAVVPDTAYPRAFRPRKNRLGQEDYEIEYNRAYDTIVEVVDPDASIVVASGRLDAYVLGFAADGLMYSADTTEDGEPVVRIWRAELPDQGQDHSN